MILADKIQALRKQAGWSQEDLAAQMGVSRQAVSKWESGMSIPDLDKVLKMSELFRVSTDYLLKDQLEGEAPAQPEPVPEEDGVRRVSLEEATAFMDLKRHYAPRNAMAVALTILSPICLILISGLAANKKIPVTEAMAGGLGVAVLLLMVAAGVMWLIFNETHMKAYEYLEKEPIALQYGVKGIVEKRRDAYTPTHSKFVAGGVGLCIVGAVPLILVSALAADGLLILLCVCALFLLVAGGVFCFVRSGSIQGSFDMLLEQDEYSPEKKALDKRVGFFPGAYWCVVTAIYLGISFSTGDWSRSWIVWPVAGVGFAALYAIVTAVLRSRNKA